MADCFTIHDRSAQSRIGVVLHVILAQNQWAAHSAAHEMTGQKSESQILEARRRIELLYSSFAESRLTAWLPGQILSLFLIKLYTFLLR